MLRKFDATVMTEFQVTAEKTSCLIPLMPEVSLDLSASCESDLIVGLVDENGQTHIMEQGKIIKLRGRNRNYQAIEIQADRNFWYRCIVSPTDEMVDPTPMQIALVQKPEDIIRSLIDERLRVWKHQQNIDRELSEDEKDDLVLDIVNGDLEFDDHPDDFGLGYEERLEEYTQRHAEQSNPEGVPAPEANTTGNKPAEGSNSSAT